jgi:hypothetical protein
MTVYSNEEIIALAKGIDNARAPKNVRWEPKPDITAYELSLALIPLLQGMNAGINRVFVEDTIANLPEGARRHFEVT